MVVQQTLNANLRGTLGSAAGSGFVSYQGAQSLPCRKVTGYGHNQTCRAGAHRKDGYRFTPGASGMVVRDNRVHLLDRTIRL